MSISKRTLCAVVAVACSVFLFFSVPAVSGQTPLNAIISVDDGAPADGNARVRVVHASPDAPNVDVWVNGSVVFANAPFQGITDYAEVPAGAYLVQVEPAGSGGAGPFVIDATLDLAANTNYTVIATDVLANLTPVILVDDNTAPAATDAKVRFVHASPDAPAVDVAVTDGPVLINNVSFQETAGPLTVPAGTYDLEARPAGAASSALTLPGVTLEGGKTYTVYATGLLAQGASDRTLYLNDGRFRVEISLDDPSLPSTFGRAVPFRDDSGLFWFFHDQNLESVVKVLDGTGTNGNYWVFYGSLSDVAFTVTVQDTQTGSMKSYTNEQGTLASFADIEAFPAN